MKPKKSKFRTLSPFTFAMVLVVLLAAGFTLLIPQSVCATKTECFCSGHSWPSAGAWIPIEEARDPIDSVGEGNGRLDFVGDSTYEGFFYYSDATYLNFRIRVHDANAATATLWSDSIWIMIDANSDNIPDYAIAWDSAGGAGQCSNGIDHALEFQVRNTYSTTWNQTDFDDIDKKNNEKVTVAQCGSPGSYADCIYPSIPGGTNCDGTGYVRLVDKDSSEGTATTEAHFGDTTFIDIALKWAYIEGATTAASSMGLPSITKSTKLNLQIGSLINVNDHNKIGTDVACGVNPGTSGLIWTNNNPTLVTLASFTATPSRNGILLEWETASEIDNAGFHIWRSDTAEGAYTQITDELIPAQGEPSMGAEYEYEDTDVARKLYTRHDKNRNRVYVFQDLADGRTYYYKLEAIDNAGVSEFFGPVFADVKNRNPKPDRTPLAGAALFLVLGSGAFLAFKRRRA